MKREIYWEHPDGSYAIIERNVTPPKGQVVMDGWSSDKVTEYDTSGRVVKEYWKTTAPGLE